MNKLKLIVEVLKDFHIELFISLYLFATYLQSTVGTQLLEDKICLNQFGFDRDDCLHVGFTNESFVIKEVSLISSYGSILGKLPAIATTLFVGTWINNYPSHLKFITIWPCIASILGTLLNITTVIFYRLDPKFSLFGSVLPWFFGTFTNAFMAIQVYIVLTNPPEKRIIKFASMNVANTIASMLGTYCGGWILDQKPWFPNQVRNYLGIYTIVLVLQLIAVTFFILKVPSVYKLNARRAEKNPDHANHDLPFKTSKFKDETSSKPVTEFISKVFSLQALWKLVHTLIKPRSNGKRVVLVLLVVSEVLQSIEMFKYSITFQFAQKVYGWSNYQYSSYNSIIRVIPVILQTFGPKILIDKLGISDVNLALMAIVSHGTEQLLLGAWLSTAGFFAATVSGCLAVFLGSALRSILCNVVDGDEVGGVFSLLSVLSSILTLGTDWVLIRVFNASLDTYPGLCYHICAFLAIFPFTIFLWIKVKKSNLFDKKQVNMVKEQQNDVNVNEAPTVIANETLNQENQD